MINCSLKCICLLNCNSGRVTRLVVCRHASLAIRFSPPATIFSLVPSSQERSKDSFSLENPVPLPDPASDSFPHKRVKFQLYCPVLVLSVASQPCVLSYSSPLSLENTKTRSLPKTARPSISGIVTCWFRTHARFGRDFLSRTIENGSTIPQVGIDCSGVAFRGVWTGKQIEPGLF